MNLAKAIGLGAFGLLALGLGGWKMLSGKAKGPSKQQTLEILENIRIDFYPILIRIAEIVEKQLAPRGMAPSQNEAEVLKDPTIKSDIEKVNEKVYVNFSEDEIRQATETVFREDGDISKHKREFMEEYRKALLGVRPDPKIMVSRKLHKSRVLETVSEILEDKIARFQTQNSETTNQSELLAFLEKDVEQDERVTKQKTKQNLGLRAKDSIKIFQFVVQEYKKSDQSFKKKYEEITSKYSERIRKMVKI